MNRIQAITIGIIAVLLVLPCGCGYNSLQGLDEEVKAAWSEVQNQYQRRFDLIPNLVSTVKGYAAHEQETLTAVVEARSKISQMKISPEITQDPGQFAQFQQAQGALSSALSRLMVVVERYPDLKANQNFSQLQEELASTENRIGFARQHYNNVVENYNTKVQSFPAVLVAGMFGFQQEEFFELAEPAEREPVKVKF